MFTINFQLFTAFAGVRPILKKFSNFAMSFSIDMGQKAFDNAPDI